MRECHCHISVESRRRGFRRLSRQGFSQSVHVSSRSPRGRAHYTSRPQCDMRGGGVRARAHACVALGRCVAFGRPKMSVWGHAGARSRTPKVACISFTRALFWNLFDGSVSIFLFETPTASPLSAIPRTCPRSARQRACRRPERCDVRAHRRRARRCARSRRRASPSPRPSHDF